MKTIKTEQLTLADVPAERARWHEIAAFCLTFDFLAEYAGKASGPTTFADDETDIKKIRRFLYLQQRIINNMYGEPDSAEVALVQRALKRLRALLSQ